MMCGTALEQWARVGALASICEDTSACLCRTQADRARGGRTRQEIQRHKYNNHEVIEISSQIHSSPA